MSGGGGGVSRGGVVFGGGFEGRGGVFRGGVRGRQARGVSDVRQHGAPELHARGDAAGEQPGEVDRGVDADGGEGRGVVVAGVEGGGEEAELCGGEGLGGVRSEGVGVGEGDGRRGWKKGKKQRRDNEDQGVGRRSKRKLEAKRVLHTLGKMAANHGSGLQSSLAVSDACA